ncbi:AAA family ATPase [Candidatus Woesearchaeota archaeon]|nr:AAA family ATPase [Candidatus Woesearchaeota archaeon]
MIITISGALGAGKSTVAKFVADSLKIRHHSTGDLMRDIALEHDMNLNQLSKIAEKEDWVDKELDEKQARLGTTEENFVIDARLGWHFIPNSIKVYLDVSNVIAAKRIWNDKENREDEDFKDFDDLLKKVEERKRSEIKRYKEYYKLNHHDKSNYDLVIDTTNKSAKEVAQEIVDFAEKN